MSSSSALEHLPCISVSVSPTPHSRTESSPRRQSPCTCCSASPSVWEQGDWLPWWCGKAPPCTAPRAGEGGERLDPLRARVVGYGVQTRGRLGAFAAVGDALTVEERGGELGSRVEDDVQESSLAQQGRLLWHEHKTSSSHDGSDNQCNDATLCVGEWVMRCTHETYAHPAPAVTTGGRNMN